MVAIDMEMPKTCYECLLSQNCFGTLICDVTKKRANKHNCPLKEVNNNSVLEDIKAEIKEMSFGIQSEAWEVQEKIVKLIDNHISGKENK